MTKNLAVVLKGKGDLRLENYPVPKPGPHDALIAVHSVGICGSDVHFWINGRIGNFVVKNPLILGHESSGTIVEVGKKVKDLKPGDRVAIEPGVPCRYCDLCKAGRYNLCLDEKFCATPPTDGTLCRYFVHSADFCYKLPPHVSYEEGALLEPLSVAVHACLRAGVTAGSSVLICGAGPIGLVNLMTVKAMGAAHICITDISENRLKLANDLGDCCQINVCDRDVSSIVESLKQYLGKLPDITIECSGAESSIQLAIKATRSGGTIVLVGLGSRECKVPFGEVASKEINLRSVFRYANCYPIALDLVASGAVDLKPLITHRFGLQESLKAFETSHTGADGAVKVIIQCQNE